MARFLFVTWPGGGNVPPAVGIAQALAAQGHAVIFAGYEPQRSRLTAAGFGFAPLARASAAMRAQPPPRQMPALVMASPEELNDLAAIIASEHPEVLVVDCLQFGALTAAERSGLPAAVLCHSTPSALAAPGGFLDAYLLAAVNDLRAAVGLPTVASLWEAWAQVPTLCTTIPALDPHATEVPASFAYIGPVWEQVPASDWQAPWSAHDPRPLVLVSFSTVGTLDQRSRIQRTLEALSSRPYRVLVTIGATDVAGLSVLENATLVPYVPHAEVLPGTAAMVTHAGHGTLSIALAHGVPLVCLPNPFIADQVPLAGC